jgi:hypothetical protein
MSAMTVVSAVEHLYAQGGGEKEYEINATGSASYDDGGSLLDLSAYFNDEVRSIEVKAQGLTQFTGQYIPDTGNAPATGKIAIFTAGTQATAADNHATTTFNITVKGTDA